MKKNKTEFRLEICDLKYTPENESIIFIKGWFHHNNYDVIVKQKNRKIVYGRFPATESKYDLCLYFGEEVTENTYGFEGKITIPKKIKEFDIYVAYEDKEILEYKIRNNKVYNISQRIKKICKMMGKAIKFFWKEYHFLVPPAMLKKYFLEFKSRLSNINSENTKCYNQEIVEEYEHWINTYENNKNRKVKLDNVSFLVLGKEKVSLPTEKVYYLDSNVDDILKKINTSYVCFLTDDCVLNSNFNYYIKKAIKDEKDFIYSDSDLIIDNIRQKPLFKPDWSPDTLLGANYIGDLFVVKTDIAKKYLNNEMKINIYNYILNLSYNSDTVEHIPHVLYHNKNRIVNQNENYDIVKNFKKGINITKNADKETLTITYKLTSQPLVSIIIPTKDNPDVLDVCLKSIYEKSTYKNYEIIVIDNNSCAPKTFDLFERYKKKYKNFSVVKLSVPFNYSYLNNVAVKEHSKGEYVVLLNNDTEVITPDWLELMLGYAMQEHIGVVGVKLLFPDNTLQHAGLIIGKGGVAGHAHYGEERYAISDQWELRIPYDVGGNTAACIMVSKEKYLKVKGLEEKLSVAFNDVDFNLKMLKEGYNNIYLPNVELYHYESKTRGLDTTPEKQKRFMQEWEYMITNWKKQLKNDPYYNSNFSKYVDYKLDATKEGFENE